MALFLLIILAFLTLTAYFVGNRGLLSPWFLLCLIFLVAYGIVLVNFENWSIEINATFVLYVFTAILAFGIGSVFIEVLYCKTTEKTKPLLISEVNVKREYPVNTLLVVSLLLSGMYTLKLLSDTGIYGSISGILRRIYDNTVQGYSPGLIFNQMSEIVRAIAYINTFRLLININLKEDDKISKIKLVIPIFLFLVTVLFSTDRNILLRYAFYSICLWVMFFYQNYKGKNPNGKIISMVFTFGIILVAIFFVYGLAKQYKSNLFRSISIYAGSGLNNFNLWIKEFNQPFMFGKATFSTFLRSIGGILGLSIDGVSDRFYEFIEYASPNGYVYSSNIYSALRPYVQDFGYLGVILYPFIVGMFYQWLYCSAKKNKYGYFWIIYCMWIYSIVFYPIAEQFIGRFHLGLCYELFWITFFYYFIFGRFKKDKIIEEIKE